MIDKIEILPEKIPEVLRIAAVQRKLIPFIGTGASQLGGCPNWTEFADRALRFLKYHQRNWLSAISGKGYEPADQWFKAL